MNIHTIHPKVQSKTWQILLKEAVKEPKELLEQLGLTLQQVSLTSAENINFPLKVPQPYIDRMEVGNAKDPLLLQVLPTDHETQQISGYITDPLAENSTNIQQGIIHKYQGRLLLITSSACAIHCRYCFRQHFPYSENRLSGQALNKALDYIEANSDVHEIILSGGDPLSVSDVWLGNLLRSLDNISHVKRIRIHTRLPVVIPARITEELMACFANSRLSIIMVLHINHANEIDDNVRQSCKVLRQNNITLLNQNVLLKGINDSVEELVNLSESLFEAGVLPYYLYCLDKVKGAAHFDMDELQVKRLYGELMRRLPGYLVPRLVKEDPGFLSKKPILPDFQPLIRR